MTNLLTRILTTLAVIPVAGVQAAPMATWGELDDMGVDNDHAILIQHVTATGIQFKINPGACWKKDNRGVFGWYSAYKNEMVICQTNKTKPGRINPDWNDEDLDTIRHEAQHLIQDCMDGELNGYLGAVYKDPIGLAQQVLGPEYMDGSRDAYSDYPEHIQVMEFEAFSVAQLNDPIEQAGDIKNFCF